MGEIALIEVAAGGGSNDPQALLSFAYRVSRTGRVLLVLNGLSRAQADRMLDTVVRDEGLDVAGLQYVDGSDHATVVRLAAAARTVVAVSEPLKSLLENSGIPHVPPDQLMGVVNSTFPQPPKRSTRREATAHLSAAPA